MTPFQGTQPGPTGCSVNKPNKKDAQDKRQTRRSRRVRFRLLAILIGFSPLIVCEVGLRIADVGRPSELEDPFVGFTAIHPLFELNDVGDRYEIGKTRLDFFRPDSFSAEKAPNEFRIFCLGGSTVQGRPFAIETSFTTWLELSLQAADPSKEWQVVNCGGVSYASYRLVPVLEECLQYEPDLFIIYTGQNEFLEARTYQDIKQTPAMLAKTHSWFSKLRTYNLARSTWINLTSDHEKEDRAELPVEVEALLDYQDGLDEYSRDDSWKEAVVEHYRYNLHRMMLLAAEADVPVILMNPSSNVRSCAPFKSEFKSNLGADDRQQFAELLQDAEAIGASDLNRAIELLEKARSIDDRYAQLHFLLGSYYELAGRTLDAKSAYLRAKEEDVCPLRILEPMQAIVLDVAKRHDLALINVRDEFERTSPGGMPGNELFVDHVHPTIDGHKKLAELVFDELVRQQIVGPQADWQTRQRQLYADNLEKLNFAYYERGRQRLEGLRRWTKGQSGVLKEKANEAN
jgi:hypothetical protein